MNITTGVVTTEQDIAAGTSFLNVPWKITNEAGEVSLEGVQAFPTETSADDVRAFLSTTLANFKVKLAGEEESKAAQAALDNAAAVASALSNISVTE